MAKSASTSPIPDVQPISPERLHFDLQNPRLVEIDIDPNADDKEILFALWKEMAVEEIAISIAGNGYFKHEPLFAIEDNNRSIVIVIEGNRRLAAVKILLDTKLQRALKTDLPKMTPSARATLKELPVVVTTREAIWQYLGFKHVNGPRPWGGLAKARYIARVHDSHGVSLEDISRLIGDQHATVRRLYRGLMVLKQADDSRAWDQEDRWNKRLYFSHLYTGLSYEGFQRFLGLKEATSYKPAPVRGAAKVKNLGELCIWLFGSKTRNERPLIKSQNPDLKNLDETLQTERGIDALRAGMPLEVARDVSLGDERIFREALTEAKISLQRAAGTVHTGYGGKQDLYDTAEGVHTISARLLDDMDDIRSAKRMRRGNRSRK